MTAFDAVELILMDEPGRVLFVQLLPYATGGTWKPEPSFAPRGTLRFTSPRVLRDALTAVLA